MDAQVFQWDAERILLCQSHGDPAGSWEGSGLSEGPHAAGSHTLLISPSGTAVQGK